MTEQDEKVELQLNITETEMEDFLRLLTDKNISEEEKAKKIKEYLESFSKNLRIAADDVAQTKIRQYKEIENHEEFIKNIVPLIQDPKIDELKIREIELIEILKQESLLLDKFYSFFKSAEDLFMVSETLSASEIKSKLQFEINIMVIDLREKGIIK